MFHPRPRFWFDFDIFNLADQMGRRTAIGGKQHRSRVQHLGKAFAHFTVDRRFDPGRRGEIGLPQGKPHRIQLREVEFDLAFNPSARRNHPRRWHALHHFRSLTFGRHATGNDRALRHSVNLAVSAI